ncbi:MAG TPA: sigma 54-interacting transcriptional regulator [Kofleriaceae bacterium]|nr:sigma 54-interacting transcriptional regulator [Kofleriaceae bacterium]
MSETLSAIVSAGAKTRAQPALFIGLAADAPRAAGARLSLADIDRVDLGRGETRAFTRRTADGARLLVAVLVDARMSTQHARITRLGTRWFVEDLASKNGTLVRGARVARHELRDGDAICVGHTMLVFREAGGEGGDLQAAPAGEAPGLSTWSPALAARFAELATAARTNVPIEIMGPSGTGKELVARAVHALSSRRGKLAAINCGALPANLLEGELFGHKKGAFTGAGDERAGLIRSADQGTLFLDEVAELPASSQAALLRVLQEGEVMPLGSDAAIKVDVRLVTATHKNLDAEVAANRFRADLRARMLGVQVVLPELRERREDLGMLVATLLERLAPDRTVTFSSDAATALYTYDWPLNIRELERALAAALAIATDRVELHHLPAAVRQQDARPPATTIPEDLTADELALRESLSAAIARHDGNLAAVARELGKDRTQIRRWMKRFGLARED